MVYSLWEWRGCHSLASCPCCVVLVSPDILEGMKLESKEKALDFPFPCSEKDKVHLWGETWDLPAPHPYPSQTFGSGPLQRLRLLSSGLPSQCLLHKRRSLIPYSASGQPFRQPSQSVKDLTVQVRRSLRREHWDYTEEEKTKKNNKFHAFSPPFPLPTNS